MKITNTVWHWKWKEALNEAKNVGGEAKYFPYIEELRAFDELPNELTPEQRARALDWTQRWEERKEMSRNWVPVHIGLYTALKITQMLY